MSTYCTYTEYPYNGLVISGVAELVSTWPEGQWRELRIYLCRRRDGVAEIWLDPKMRERDPGVFDEQGFMVRPPLHIVDKDDKLLLPPG